MASKGMAVAVTGASGYLGGRLIRQLCADDRVDRVLGFDRRSGDFTHEKYVFDSVDIRDEALVARLDGVDVVVHLAFIMDPIHDETAMRDVNVNGSQNVFRCAGKAGVRKIVYTSSAVAYGAHPNNPELLTEDAPLRANLDFSYAAHKLEVEYVAREFADEYPDVAMTIFRPAIVFGPNVDNAWSHLFETPYFLAIKGYDIKLQFVHEDDVLAALAKAVVEDMPGAYNLAPDGWLDLDQMLEVTGRKRFDIPESIAFPAMERLWDMGLAEGPAGMVHYGMHPWLVDNSRIKETGFTFRYGNGEAFEAGAERIREVVRLGSKRVQRRDLRRGGLMGLGVVGSLVAYKTLRRALSRS